MSVSNDTYLLQPDVEKALESWIKNRTTSGFFLYGPPGVGKTTLVYRVLKSLGYHVVELNASHTRTGTAFRKSILPLLKHGGVGEWITQGSPEKIAVLLDEIDGFSSGERGGLQELLAFARAWKPNQNTRPLILISNTVEGRPMEQLRRQCVSMKVRPPIKEIVSKWLKRDIPDEWISIGDIREIMRLNNGLQSSSTLHFQEETEVSDILIHAWSRLYDDWDPYEQIWLANHETNLAGLVLHENLTTRIQHSSKDTINQNSDLYENIFSKLMVSDKADFVAFFYQCWPVLRISQKLKLVVPQQILNKEIPLLHNSEGVVSEKLSVPGDLIFTKVLAKQSALFNAWKEMCKAYDNGFEKGNTQIPIRLSCVLAADPLYNGSRFNKLAFPLE